MFFIDPSSYEAEPKLIDSKETEIISSFSVQVPVYIEIIKHTNIKYELNKDIMKLEVDRVLEYPFFYPYSYGFILNTDGNDGDELDALLITERDYSNDIIVNTKIIGGLVMEDESGLDEKIFVVPSDEYDDFNKLTEEKKNKIYSKIYWFFSNYKNEDKDKWSKVHNLMDQETAIELYNKCKQPKLKSTFPSFVAS